MGVCGNSLGKQRRLPADDDIGVSDWVGKAILEFRLILYMVLYYCF